MCGSEVVTGQRLAAIPEKSCDLVLPHPPVHGNLSYAIGFAARRVTPMASLEQVAGTDDNAAAVINSVCKT